MDLVTNPQYHEIILVRAVKPLEPYKVQVVFTDGSEREIDLEPYLHGPIFQPIRDNPQVFASVFVDPEGHTLAWPNGADIAPETLYYEGPAPWATQVKSRSSRRPSDHRRSKRQITHRRSRAKVP